jgi:type IV pilus assembly protein PilM
MAIKMPDLGKLKLLGNFQSKKTETFALGIDIGTSTIKAVKLKIAKDAIELIGSSLEHVQVDLVPVLKKIGQELGSTKVNFSLAGPSTIIRYAPFPRMQTEELRQSLKFEAQKHIPFSVADVQLDASILRSDLPDNKMMVLIAAAKKELLTQRLKILDEAGLHPHSAGLDSLALINAFNYNYAGEEGVAHKTIALLNIGATLSNVNILEDGLPKLSRDIHTAGNHLTQKILDSIGGDFKSAEEAKLAGPSDKAAKIAAATEAVLANLAREVRISFDYYESQNASSVSKIFLSGGSAGLAGIKETLTGLLGIEVELWDPCRKILVNNPKEAEKIKAQSHCFAVAMGTALRG